MIQTAAGPPHLLSRPAGQSGRAPPRMVARLARAALARGSSPQSPAGGSTHAAKLAERGEKIGVAGVQYPLGSSTTSTPSRGRQVLEDIARSLSCSRPSRPLEERLIGVGDRPVGPSPSRCPGIGPDGLPTAVREDRRDRAARRPGSARRARPRHAPGQMRDAGSALAPDRPGRVPARRPRPRPEASRRGSAGGLAGARSRPASRGPRPPRGRPDPRADLARPRRPGRPRRASSRRSIPAVDRRVQHALLRSTESDRAAPHGDRGDRGRPDSRCGTSRRSTVRPVLDIKPVLGPAEAR